MNGQHRVGLYATNDILPKQEILFDYDGLNILANRFSWVDDHKNGVFLGNKKLRKEKKKVEKNCIELDEENMRISIEEIRKNLEKKKRNIQKLKEEDVNGDEIEIDIFDLKK